MSDLNTRMPSGSDVIQRTDEQPAFIVDLLESILQTANIAAAWKRGRANKGAAGIDGMIQQAIAQVLTPIFDSTFSENSFGFRPNRNGQQALKQIHSIIKTGRRYTVDVDLGSPFSRDV